MSHGVTTTRSVLSLDCSPDTVDKSIDSGVSEASKSSIVSRVICSAFSWASVTFCSASSINFLRTTYSTQRYHISPQLYLLQMKTPHLNRLNAGVLCNVLVLIQSIFCWFSFSKTDTKFHEKDHHRLQRGNRSIAGPLRRHMFMKKFEGSLVLAHSDEFLCSLNFSQISGQLIHI